MSERRRSLAGGRRAVEVSLVILGLAALVVSALRDRPFDRPTDDERDYLSAAANLTRSGTLSFAPPGDGAPRPDAYREPGYPLLIAATWWTSGLTPPASAAEVEELFLRPAHVRSIRALHLVLLALAAAAAGWAAGQMGGRLAGAAAFLLVAASPALQESGAMIMSEVLAAAAMALLSAALLAAARGRIAGAVTATAIAAVLPLFRAEALLLVPLAGLAAAWATPVVASGRAWSRGRAVVAALLLAALPSVCWMARNQVRFGAAMISDRSGVVLAIRAALDDEVARVGLLPALLVWTPFEGAQAKARELAPGSPLASYRWTGEGNFFTRTIRDWRRERASPGADPLAVDRRYRRAALQSFLEHPGAHLRATAAVSWRGLFAERSPAFLHPFDVRLAVGLLHLAALALFAFGAVSRHDSARLACLLPSVLLFAFHAFGTEFLPRFAVPLLPSAWVAVAVVLFGARLAKGGEDEAAA